MEITAYQEATFNEKLALLAQTTCPLDILQQASQDHTDYTSSRLRKAVALNPNTPKSIIQALLKDEYRWVVEAAASHQSIALNEFDALISSNNRYLIKGLLLNPNCTEEQATQLKQLLEDEEKYPIQLDSYTLGFDCNVYPAEHCIGNVEHEALAECIVNYEGEWSSYLWDNDWYEFDNILHCYGMADVARDVEYPNGERMEIAIPVAEDVDKGEIDFSDYSDYTKVGFVCQGISYEKGYGWDDWMQYTVELEYELIPECIIPDFDEGICSGYSYEATNLDGTEVSEYFECSDSYSTTGKGTDFDINVYPEDIIEEMEKAEKDPTDMDQVLAWLEEKYS